MNFPLLYQPEYTELDPNRYDGLTTMQAINDQYQCDLIEITEVHDRNMKRIDLVYRNQMRLLFGFWIFFMALLWLTWLLS